MHRSPWRALWPRLCVAAPRQRRAHWPGCAARQAAAAVDGLRHSALTAIAEPGAADALLGVETGGIAPAFSPLADTGGLTRSARAWLAARGISPETALADLLAGRDPFPAAG